MVFLSSLRAEALKLFSTRSIWWTSGIFFLVVFASSLLATVGSEAPMASMIYMIDPRMVLYALPLVGYPILAIQAIMVVTTEYRYHVQQATYTAVPQRWVVVASKFLLYGVFAAVLTFLTALLSVAVAHARVPFPEYAFKLSDPAVWELLGQYALGAAAVVLFAQGIGLLIRHTAGAVGLFLAWILAGEQILSFIPKIGSTLANWMPFNHLSNFLNRGAVLQDFGSWTSGGYFLLCAAVLYLAGMVVVYRRDP